MKWTKDQAIIINRRTGTLLVSAAAGSGKTAVLVERILKWIVEDRKNIDEFLVVTFTKAAAAQMKSKIRIALEKLQEENAGDEHIIRQLSLIHRANIMTIDSFCKSIFNEHFHRLQLDPTMRVMDDTEGVLLQEDVLERVLEQAYEEYPDAMQELHGYMNDMRSNESIVKLIRQIHNRASSFPYPELWYQKAEEDARAIDADAVEHTKWIEIILQETRSILEEVRDIPEKILSVYQEIGMSYNEKNYAKYEAFFAGECELVQQVEQASTYREMQEAFTKQRSDVKRFSWKNTGVPETEEIADLWKIYNEGKKAAAKNVKEPMEEILRHQQDVSGVLLMILQLSKTFTAEYLKEKQKKNCMDFSDVEHYALQILQNRQEDGSYVPSEVAIQLQNSYVEIMIDEYQDSNDLQEEILTSIAKRDGSDCCNMFMVGDVKQSIYKFRMARPDLFRSKYDAYDAELESETVNKKTELSQNFRSRPEVLFSVNRIFYQIMRKSLGGIAYHREAALAAGKIIEGIPEDTEFLPVNARTEVIMVDAVTPRDEAELSGNGDVEGDSREEAEEETVDAVTLEARVIANKIHELCDKEHPFPIWDEDKKRYRACSYRDIMILLRTNKGIAEDYRQVLLSCGIPAYAESGKGYFDSVEVKNVLNMLSVIDNSRDDIAMAGVLRSPLVELDDEALAKLRVKYRKCSLWDAVQNYCKDEDSEAQIVEKLRLFMTRLAAWKEKKTYCTIRELLWDILNETGYYIYLMAMPHGNIRQANIHKLIEKATAYETTSYRGLFDFLRYIERVRIADQDFGEASVLGANDDLVQIMTIHKSKGLEFPVVILGACGKEFNMMDNRNPVLVDADAYLAVDDKHLDKHYFEKTEKRKCLVQHMKEEILAEEMRILYVAMTRAQEKLIVVGTVKKRMADNEHYQLLVAADRDREASGEASVQNIVPLVHVDNEKMEDPVELAPIAKTQLLKCSSYLAWFVECLYSMYNMNIKPDVMEYHIVTPDVLDIQVKEEIERTYQVNDIWQQRVQMTAAEEDRKKIAERFQWKYEHLAAATKKGKLSVSEIKKMSQIVDEDAGEKQEYRKVVYAKASGGAAYGTLVHLVMEKLPFAKADTPEAVRTELQLMVEKGILTVEEAKQIPIEKIYKMLNSSLGQRMTAADKDGKLYKERQFVMGVPMKDVYPDADGNDLELIQGIIDAYFEEDGEYVLMDYKTDRVSEEHGAEELTAKYHAQLEYYKRTLEQLTDKPVKEVYIYSFALDAELRL